MSATGKPIPGPNIPSLVLTNNDIISPIVCLFDTTGHLMGGLEQGEGKEERQSQKKGQKEQENIKQTQEQQHRKKLDKREKNKHGEDQNTRGTEIVRGDKTKENCSYRSRTPQPKDDIHDYNESLSE